jgi:hypothetical protein
LAGLRLLRKALIRDAKTFLIAAQAASIQLERYAKFFVPKLSFQAPSITPEIFSC